MAGQHIPNMKLTTNQAISLPRRVCTVDIELRARHISHGLFIMTRFEMINKFYGKTMYDLISTLRFSFQMNTQSLLKEI